MALTATATSQTGSVVTIYLDEPLVIGLNADRSNTKYIIKPNQTVDKLSTTLANELIVTHPKYAQNSNILSHTV